MDKLYNSYLNKLKVNENASTDAIHILNENEIKLIKKAYYKTAFQAALLAALGVVFYYLPIYFISVFSEKIPLQLFGFSIEIAPFDILLCVILTVLEILLLTGIHLRMVHQIASVSGFINPNNKVEKIAKLKDIATAKKDSSSKQFGLNPYQEINKNALIFVNLLTKLKGFLANKILKYLIKRFAGRFAVKTVLDFAAIPVYAFLNVWATYLIYKNAKAEIFGFQLINQYVAGLNKTNLTKTEQKLIYDSLQLIAICKVDFHSNHSYFTEKIISHFEIPIEDKHIFNESFYTDFKEASAEIKNLCAKILTLGFILDGSISFSEKIKLRKLQDKVIIPFNTEYLNLETKNFIAGRKMELLENNFFK